MSPLIRCSLNQFTQAVPPIPYCKGYFEKLLLPSFLILLLAALLTGSALAQAELPPDQAVAGLTFTPLFVGHENPYAYSHTVVDASGGVHMVYIASYDVYYTYCPSECDQPDQWTIALVEGTGSPYAMHPTLALTPAGQPRLMWYIFGDGYFYAECNTNCTNPDKWSTVYIGSGSAAVWDHYMALDSQGRPRLVYPKSGGFVYVGCDAGCTNADNWTINQLPGLALSGMQLALTNDDQPRVTGLLDNVLYYLSCSSNCLTDGEWYYETLTGEVANNYAFRLDPQGRPRLAFYSIDEADTVLTYAWANSNPLDVSNWYIYKLNFPANRSAVEMQINAQGQPFLAYVSDTGGLSYAACTANCEADHPTWEQTSIETNEELDAAAPVTASPGCQVQGWQVGRHISMAKGPADAPYVSYHVSNYEDCSGDDKMLGYRIRLALPQAGSPPVAPTQVNLSGLSSGWTGSGYTFSASISPDTASLPVTFIWEATDLATQTHTLNRLSDQVTFTWPAGSTGQKTVKGTVRNSAASISATTTITLTEAPPDLENQVFLPHVQR